MFKLPIRTWICNAAAVLCTRHGAVTDQAHEAGCSRETVYEHARKVEQRLADAAQADLKATELEVENQRLRDEVTALRQASQDELIGNSIKQRRVAVTAFAMGLSLRQIEDLLKLLLPPSQAPDHATIGRWVQAQAEQATEVLAVLDAACAPRVQTLAIDEIFFGGGRPWSASNPRA
jgi:AcrR family transcriptional regulator